MMTSSGPVTVQLLADHAQLIAAVGALRWREWGHAPDPEDREWWIAVTAREAGRDHLPLPGLRLMRVAKRSVRWVSARSISKNGGTARRGC